MQKQHVQLGKTYIAKISGSLTTVRLDKEHASGGWVATNLETNKPVRIRTAGKLRREAHPQETGEPATPKLKTKSKKKTKPKAEPITPATQSSRKTQPQTIRIKAGETFVVRSGKSYVIQMANATTVYGRQLREGSPAGPTRPFDRKSIEEGFPRGTRGADSFYPKSEALEAAATILSQTCEPMDAKDLIAEIRRQKLWFTTGRTPHLTLAAAIGRDILKKGTASRFERVGRGRFQLRKSAKTPKSSKKSKTTPKTKR